MLLLALDTSTSAATAALHGESGLLAEHSVIDAQGHGEQLAPAIVSVLDQAGRSARDLDQVAVGRGPGPFTGLRVGLMTAMALGFALDLPVLGVDSLDALAYRVITDLEPSEGFLVATDARRKEVYWAWYQPDRLDSDPGVVAQRDLLPAARPVVPGWTRVAGPAVDRPAALTELADLGVRASEIPVAGRGGRLYPDAFGPRLGILDVDAAAVAGLAVARQAAGYPPLAATPMYLRRPDATAAGPRKRVTR